MNAFKRPTVATVIAAGIAVALAGCGSSDSPSVSNAAQTSAENGKSQPLWSVLGMEADYDIPTTVKELVTTADPAAIIRGRVTGAAPGQYYKYNDGADFETAYLTVRVAEAHGIDAATGETVTVEVVKSSLATPQDLSTALISDNDLLLLIDGEPMFPPSVEATDLDPSTSAERVLPCGYITALLSTDADGTVALVTGDEVLKESPADSTSELFDEVVAQVQSNA